MRGGASWCRSDGTRACNRGHPDTAVAHVLPGSPAVVSARETFAGATRSWIGIEHGAVRTVVGCSSRILVCQRWGRASRYQVNVTPATPGLTVGATATRSSVPGHAK
jgi:hypothetical protein